MEEIEKPRRILLLGAPDSGALKLLVDITGSAPDPVDGSTAGLSHVWNLKTKYYTASLPVWIDEIADPEAWREEFTRPEAKEVVTSLGAWIYCFRRPVEAKHLDAIKDTLKAIAQAIERAAGFSFDGACLAVAMPQGTAPYLDMAFEEWEGICGEYGFEYVDSEAKGRNEFGEPVGLQRVTEALETTDWAGDDSSDLVAADDLDDEDKVEFSDSFAAEEAEMGLELLGLKSAIASGGAAEDTNDHGEQEQVEELARMMSKLQAIKDTGAAMPEQERKKFAAKAVNDLMKDL